jgi:ketosteroid isomerase-like protein
MSTQELADLIRQGAASFEGGVVEGTEAVGMLEMLLSQTAAPDFVTVMHSQSRAREYEGIAGFREAMADWMSPYERFRYAFDRIIVADDRALFLVRQLARTKHESVEIETPSGSVWWFEDGKISQAVFYLDRADALKAAGIDPDRLEAD